MVSAGWRYDPITGGSGSEQDRYTGLISGESAKITMLESKNPAQLFSKGARLADRYYKTAKILSSSAERVKYCGAKQHDGRGVEVEPDCGRLSPQAKSRAQPRELTKDPDDISVTCCNGEFSRYKLA